jgi:hypothetical protein
VTSVFSVDTANVVRRSNIILSHPNVQPQQFMPLGNGTLGVAAWAAQGFTAQLNRTDTLPDRKSPGQVIIPGLATLTGAADFHGSVDLYDATLSESGGGMSATVFVRADAAELVVDVTGADPNSMQTAQIKLWSGRSPSTATANGVAALAETWTDSGGSGQTFGSMAAVAVGGRNATASVVDPLTVQVSFQPNADGSFRVVIACPTWTGGDALSTAGTVLGSDTTAPLASLQTGHLAWWHDYWSRVGLLKMTSSDGAADYFEALRTIYLYATAAESRGVYPGTQAGLADIFSYLEDNQPWTPSAYWFWNLRMQVAANMSSGAFDMNAPMFHLYQSNLKNIEAWTQSKMSGRQGICVPETMRFYGTGDQCCNESAAPNWNALTITTGAEIGLWIWQHYLMTGDAAFLSANYPVMSEVAQFLLAYATMGSDGLLHTFANAHETQWGVNDPVTDIVAMKAFFPAVIAAAGKLGMDAALVTQLQDALTKIPPLPRTDTATHSQLLTAADDAAGQDVFAISYQPGAQKHNSENLDLEAVWPYGLIGDTSPDIALARRTYMNRMFVNSPDWTFDAIHAARLGLADEMVKALTKVTENYQTFVGGLALWAGGTNNGSSESYIEQAGVVVTAVNEAFVQDFDGLLRIAPAWPMTWDASGTIYIPGQSKVDVEVQSGQVVMAVIEAGSSMMMQIRNPWTQAAAVVDGTTGAPVVPSATAQTFELPVTSGHWYAVVPAGAVGALPTVRVTGTPATAPKTLGSVGIGL